MVGRSIRAMLLGPPGVGKGTYTKVISQRLHLPIVAAGELVRQELKANTELGQKLNEYSSKGKLVPDNLVLPLLNRRIEEVVHSGKGFLLDGFPRTIAQAQRFQEISALDLVLNLSMEPWMLTAKLLGRRNCSACGKSFNVADVTDLSRGIHMPPMLPNNGSSSMCDCGAPLETRQDDTEDVIRHSE